MSILKWDKSIQDFVRGSAIESVVLVDNIESLHTVFVEAWAKVCDIAIEFSTNGSFSLLVEVWSDTGRIIFLLRESRDIARVVLAIPALEREYYSLPEDEKEFEVSLRSLFESMLVQLIETLPRTEIEQISGGNALVVARNADDKDSNRILLSFS